MVIYGRITFANKRYLPKKRKFKKQLKNRTEEIFAGTKSAKILQQSNSERKTILLDWIL